MRGVEHRIAYYLKKVSQFTSTHPSKKRNPYRHERLMAYKEAMHKRIADKHPKIYGRYANES